MIIIALGSTIASGFGMLESFMPFCGWFKLEPFLLSFAICACSALIKILSVIENLLESFLKSKLTASFVSCWHFSLQPPFYFWSGDRPKTLWAIQQLLNEAKNKEWNQNQAQQNHSLIPCFHSKIFPINHFWKIQKSRKKAEDVLGIAEKCYVISQAKCDKLKLKWRKPNEIWQGFDYIFHCLTNLQRKKCLNKFYSEANRTGKNAK